MMKSRVLYNPLYGRFTTAAKAIRSYNDAIPQKASNYWSSTEYNTNNAWNVNFNSGNVNNNNKYNTNNVARGVAAHDEKRYSFAHLPKEAQDSADFALFFKTVVVAYKDCMRGKRSSKQALEYMAIAWYDLPSLAWELFTCTYKPTTSTAFMVKYPKYREVFAANFRDRIVHHWICLRLEPLFEYRFVSQGNVSFNCRKGFGTSKCIDHVASGMKRVSHCYTKEAWVFKGDLVGFFMSIDKNLMWYLLSRYIQRWRSRAEIWGFEHFALYDMPEMYWDILSYATERIVKHHPEDDCVLNSPPSMWRNLAKNKSLFGVDKSKGGPIGNLTTQLFVNFLMSYFDAYVQWLYRGHNFCYARFVDDFVIVCDDKEFILKSLPKIEECLQRLKLTMHKDKRYLQPVSHGVMFVGSYIKPNRIYLSNRTLARFEEKVTGFGKLIDNGKLTPVDCQRIEQVVNSYLGFCKDRRTYKKRAECIGMMGSKFFEYFFIRGRYDSIRVRPKYRPMKTM